jgi:hypothetical protein
MTQVDMHASKIRPLMDVIRYLILSYYNTLYHMSTKQMPEYLLSAYGFDCLA